MEGKLLTMKEWEDVARRADYNPGKMAALCSISERQMQRLFQQHVKCTPGRWLRQLQCRLAKQLISQGYSNKAIAAELKFSCNRIWCGCGSQRLGDARRFFFNTSLLLTATTNVMGNFDISNWS